MSNLYSEKPSVPQRLNLSNHITNEFAQDAAREAFGRNWVSPAARTFQDVAPAESLAARKAASFGDCDPVFDNNAAAFEGAVRWMGAAT